MRAPPKCNSWQDADAELSKNAQLTADAIAVLSGGRHVEQQNQQHSSHGDWSIFPKLTVQYAFRQELTFCGLKRYITVGQLRELVAAQLFLPASCVSLEVGGERLVFNAITLEDALDSKTKLTTSYISPNSSKLYSYASFNMTVHSPVRRLFIAFVEWPWFDRASLFLIALNAIGMMLSDPLSRRRSAIEHINSWSDPIISILFTLEMLCKVLASGLMLSPHTYFRDGWNWIDAAVVVSAWLTWETPGVLPDPDASSSAAAALKPLRTVRVLRPLRTVTRVRGMRVVVQSLLKSIPEMASVLTIMAFIFVFFGVFGVQLFAGSLRWRCVPDVISVEPCARNVSLLAVDCTPSAFSVACEDAGSADCLPLWASAELLDDYDAAVCNPSGACDAGSVCTYFTSTPNNNQTSFDSFPRAFVTIFYSITLEGWVDTMYMVMKADPDLGWLAVIFFVALILLGSVFVFNLLLAVVFDNFSSTNAASRAEENDEDEDEGREAYMLSVAAKKVANRAGSLQQRCSSVEMAIVRSATKGHISMPESATAPEAEPAQARPEATTPAAAATSTPRPCLARFVSSVTFESAIILAILANTCVMAADSSPPPFGLSIGEMQAAQLISSAIFGSIFFVEMVLKICAFGLRGYYKNWVNRFDCVIVIVSIVEVAVQAPSLGNDDSGTSGLLSLLRTLKGLRTLRLLRLMNLVKGMRKVVLTLTKSAEHILYLFLILVLFWVIFALLGMETLAVPLDPVGSRFTYKDIYYAMVNVFVVLSGENWNDLLFEASGHVGPWAAIYYILVLVMGNWIILNLFVAILLANINDLSIQEQQEKLRATRALLRKLTRRSSTKSITRESTRARIHRIGTRGGTTSAIDQASASATPPPSPPQSRDLSERHQAGVDVIYSPGRLTMTSWFFSCLYGARRQPMTRVRAGTFRACVLSVVEHNVFAGLVQFLIALSSISLIIDLPGTVTAGHPLKDVLYYSEYFFNVVFSVEMALKLVAYGVYGYFSFPWNLLDSSVVVISWMALVPALGGLDFLRAIRSVRMLKLASIHEGMRVVIVALYQSLPAVCNVMMFLILFLVIFGILGMQLNAGRWHFCDIDLYMGNPYDAANRTFSVLNRDECTATHNGTWMAPHYGDFDNIFKSVLVLFETATLERWPDVMLWMADAAGHDLERPLDTAPIPSANNDIDLFVILFWVMWIFVSAFVIMNLFVGVVVENVTRNQEREDGTIFLTARQQKWVLVMSFVSTRRAPRIPVPPQNPLRRKAFFLVISHRFEVFIMTMIIIAVVAMATNAFIMHPVHVTIMKVLNYIFCAIFLLECILKLVGLGIKRYFSDAWNNFDFVLVAFSLVDLCLDTLNVETAVEPVFMRAFRLVRIGRLLRLIKGFKSILRMLHTVVMSLPALVNVIGLMSLLLVIYAIAGVSLFYNVSPKEAQFIDFADGGYVSFQSFPAALLTLFRCVTGESWNGIMHDLMITDSMNPRQCSQATPEPHLCVDTEMKSIIFFVTFTVFATFMLLNLLIGVILQNFSNTLASGGIRCISSEQIDDFARVWQMFDPTATNVIPKARLPHLIHTMRVHSWIHNRGLDVPVSLRETISLIRQMEIPIHDGQANYQETLQAIARAIHHGFNALKKQEMLEVEHNSVKPVDPKLLQGIRNASHQEVSRARAKTYQQLAQMRYRSLVRTGVVRKSPLPRTKSRAQRAAPYVIQWHWRALCMRRMLRKLARTERGGVNLTRMDVFRHQCAIAAFMTLKRMQCYRLLGGPRLRQGLRERAMRIGEARPHPKPLPEAFVLESSTMRKLAARTLRKHQERAPMTTVFAAQLIQATYREKLERGAYHWLLFGVTKFQAHYRALKERREMRSLIYEAEQSLKAEGHGEMIDLACGPTGDTTSSAQAAAAKPDIPAQIPFSWSTYDYSSRSPDAFAKETVHSI